MGETPRATDKKPLVNNNLKTTLAYEIGRKYGRNAMLILEVGQENGVEHLYDAYVDEVKTWQDLTDVIDDIVEYRDTDYSHLKFICIDSTDELFRLAEQEVVRLHNKECQPDKRTKSINSAFGGFGRGMDKAVDLVVETIWKLKEVNLSLFFIGHTKMRTKKDPLTEIEFEQLTTNMNNKYDNTIKDKVYVTATAYLKREVDHDKGRIIAEERVISFRDQSFAVDTKSRFRNIKPSISFSADEFISAIEDAIRAQIEDHTGPVSEQKLAEMKERQATENEVANKVVSREERIGFITENYAKLIPSAQKDFLMMLKEHNIKKVQDADDTLLNKLFEFVKSNRA